mmetsp:Transcript_54485/g.176277  ORF Transcript_54485/g.176277 Transcript_54485/m.176277 type:complete len:227 (+) Transcript_54485:373-1053(+)
MVDDTLQHCMQLKFRWHGAQEKCATTCKIEQNVNQRFFVFASEVGTHRDGHTPVTCFVPVDQGIYDSAEACTSVDPCQAVDLANVDLVLREEIDKFLKRNYDGDGNVQDLQASRVKFDVYRAGLFAWDGVGASPEVLRGDAAYGVPYFRALNEGFQCASQLAAMYADMAAQGLGLSHIVENYATFMEKQSSRSIGRVRLLRSSSIKSSSSRVCKNSLIPSQAYPTR